MKCSVGVAIAAMVVLLCSALTLVAAAGAAYMFLGPMSGQLFDPSVLPPGADVKMMRAFGVGGALMLTALGSLGLATGIGLIRLWRWSRYSAIVFGVVVIAFSLVSGVATMFIPMPTRAGGAPELPAAFRFFLAGFYGVFALAAGGFAFFLARKKTAAQFAAGMSDHTPPLRPLSVTIIAWIMIVSAGMMLPGMAMMTPPAVFLGLVLTGFAAKLFYVGYMVAYLAIGIGLIRQTSQALMPAIPLHALAVPNALAMLLPSTWTRYHEALANASPMLASQPIRPWAQYSSVVVGLIYAGIVLYFLMAARYKLIVRSDQD
jgi:hypothetical protein